jgi:hypothetical protein
MLHVIDHQELVWSGEFTGGSSGAGVDLENASDYHLELA